MSYSIDSHNSNRIGNLVNYTIVAHANSPIVLCSSEFATARTRIIRERRDTIDHLIVNARRKPT